MPGNRNNSADNYVNAGPCIIVHKYIYKHNNIKQKKHLKHLIRRRDERWDYFVYWKRSRLMIQENILLGVDYSICGNQMMLKQQQ